VNSDERQNALSPLQAWMNVVLGALLMLATLPGRTQGLSLITEPLLSDLHLDRIVYAEVNLWATLLGALFCFPAGQLLDCFGLRLVGTVITFLLGVVVWALSRFSGHIAGLFLLILLTRALGQSALSVVSITAVGKSFARKLGPAMGVYSFLLSAFFVVAFILLGKTISNHGWRAAWFQIAIALTLFVTPLILFFLKTPASSPAQETMTSDTFGTASANFGVAQALRTPTFWIFGGATALFGLVSSGLGLFNEAVLAERGFDRTAFHNFLAFTTFAALLGQLLCGWLSTKLAMRRLLGIAMLLYSIALAILPLIKSLGQLWLLATLIGTAAGFITVLFFAIWSHAFGRAHLGRIQGAAQILTVLASAIGPLLFAKCAALTGSYTPVLWTLACIVIVFAIASWTAALPTLSPPSKPSNRRPALEEV
jgi:MFS family permease